jgi:diacylglycerol O-acyltransferase / wax synthase
LDQLSGLDSAFLYWENATTHMHVGLVTVFDGATLGGCAARRRVIELLEARLHLVPPLRRRLVVPAGGLVRAGWVDDPAFSLDDHVFAMPALTALTDDVLVTLAADIMRRPLDRRKPLWEMYVLEGRDDRRVAIITKVHHSAIDGISGIGLFANLVDMTPEGRPVPQTERVTASRAPGAVEIARMAVGSFARQPLDTARVVGETVGRVRSARRAAGTEEPAAGPLLVRAPSTMLSRPISDRRGIALATLPMDDIELVRKLLGGTVNDVVLTVCGTAVKAYLARRGDVPSTPLVAAVPVSLRTEEHAGTTGNVASIMTVSLATDIDEPWVRYGVIRANARASKGREAQLRAGELVSQWLELTRPALGSRLGRYLSTAARALVGSNHSPPCNVVISNIPGPPVTVYMAGMETTAIHPLGPIIDGVPLNITVLSYSDMLHVGIVSCPRTVPDVDELPGLLRAALDELVASCRADGA